MSAPETLIAMQSVWRAKGPFMGFKVGNLIQVDAERPRQGEWRRFRCRYPSNGGIAHLVLDEVEILRHFEPWNPDGMSAKRSDGKDVEVVPREGTFWRPKGQA